MLHIDLQSNPLTKKFATGLLITLVLIALPSVSADDSDDDGDGIVNNSDRCSQGHENWTSNITRALGSRQLLLHLIIGFLKITDKLMPKP